MSSSSSAWDNALIANIAFRPRTCSAATSIGRWTDSSFPAADGTLLAYRLYTAPETFSPNARNVCVLLYFHSNAELCTDLECHVERFFGCGFSAIVCPEFRGYAWSEGRPSLRMLCSDAEAVMDALPKIMTSAGLKDIETKLVLHGRSLGTACAIHLAAEYKLAISALIVESGVVELLKLPMVRKLGAMMPQILFDLRSEPAPLDTLHDMCNVAAPTLIIHGDKDEMSPVDQARTAYQVCGSGVKKLAVFPGVGHNDLRSKAREEYFDAIKSLCQALLAGNEIVFSPSHQAYSACFFPDDVFSMLTCYPGPGRCCHDDDAELSA